MRIRTALCSACVLASISNMCIAVRSLRDTLPEHLLASDSHGAWSYLKADAVGGGQSTTYVPTLADIDAAQFIADVVAPTSGRWTWEEFGGFHEDVVRVFRTYLFAEIDMHIDVVLTGDDGHALYQDRHLLTGGGFGSVLSSTIEILGGHPSMVEVATYNGPGGWFVDLRRPDDVPLESIPGLWISTDPNIPEPASMAYAAMLLMVLNSRLRRSR